jgi:hypothetical protein
MTIEMRKDLNPLTPFFPGVGVQAAVPGRAVAVVAALPKTQTPWRASPRFPFRAARGASFSIFNVRKREHEHGVLL